MRGFSTNISLLFASPHSNTRQYYDIGCRRHGICDHGSMSTLITKLFRKNRILIICPLSQIVLSAVTSVFLIQYNTIQYNKIQHRLFPTENTITPQQQFLPNIGMGGKGVDRRIILSWSTPYLAQIL